MRVKHLLAIGVLLGGIAGTSGCMLTGVQGSGVAKSETRVVEPFTRIESGGTPDIVVDIAPQQSLSIESDDNILPLIITEVKDGTLVVSSRESYSTRIGVKVHIAVPSLDGARIAGSGSLTASNLNAKHFDAHISGSGDIRLGGSAESLSAGVFGSGDINAAKLSAQSADVKITGSGDVNVNATQSLQAQITGSGNIRYSGNPPQVQKQVTGSGSVRAM